MDNKRRGPTRPTCYFCNKNIENESEVGHIAVCGNVLVPCPNKCGSYVSRIDLEKHKRECVNRVTKSMPRLNSLDENLPYTQPYQYLPASTSSLDRNTNGYPQKRPDAKLNEEIFKLSRKLADLERLYIQSQQRSPIQGLTQHFETLKTNQAQQSLEIEKIKYHNKVTTDWRKNIEAQIYSLKQSLSVFQNIKKETDFQWMNIQDRLVVLDKLQADISYLRDSLFKDQAYHRQTCNNIQQDLNNFKNLFNQENATFASVYNEQKVTIDNLKQETNDIRRIFEEQKTKFTNTVFDLRAASQIASEAAERIEIIERDFLDLRKEINQIKLDLEILEGLSSSCDSNISSGRLLWRVSEVEAKMQRAIDMDTVFKSPVFYTHEYGYKIRILMYMNGLKKWKDRYALLCIHVLKGEYDMLLKWPCHIEGTITLRDLETPEKGKPFSKFITAKRQCGDEESEEPQESSSTFIFIPHSTLLKSNYVKEDTLFIDINIQKNAKFETSL